MMHAAAAALLGVVAALQGEAPGRPPLTLAGTVVHEGGTPLNGAIVYALDSKTKELLASARSDTSGKVTLTIDEGRTVLVGVTMRTFEISRFQRLARDRFRLVLRNVPWDLRSGKAVLTALAADRGLDAPAFSAAGPGLQAPAGVLRGTVRDDVDAPLAGVRVAAYEDEASMPLGTIKTDQGGRFEIVLPPGRYRVVPLAPGLKPSRYQRPRPGQVQITLTVDTSPETIEIKVSADKTLRFRMEDSIWPEYWPPPQVKAYLRHSRGLDLDQMIDSTSMQPLDQGPPPYAVRRPSDVNLYPRATPMPLSVGVRRLGLTKYWWLKLLYAPRGNPARASQW
jgi:hypothetical protein